MVTDDDFPTVDTAVDPRDELVELTVPVDHNRAVTVDDFEPTPVLAKVAQELPEVGRGSYRPRARHPAPAGAHAAPTPIRPQAALYARGQRGLRRADRLTARRRRVDVLAAAGKAWAFMVGTSGTIMFVGLFAYWPDVLDKRVGLTSWGGAFLWAAVAMCLTTSATTMWLLICDKDR